MLFRSVARLTAQTASPAGSLTQEDGRFEKQTPGEGRGREWECVGGGGRLPWQHRWPGLTLDGSTRRACPLVRSSPQLCLLGLIHTSHGATMKVDRGTAGREYVFNKEALVLTCLPLSRLAPIGKFNFQKMA